jgi:hypothetical protein
LPALGGTEAATASYWLEHPAALSAFVSCRPSHTLPPAPGQKFRREQFGMAGFRALLFMLATLGGGLMH